MSYFESDSSVQEKVVEMIDSKPKYKELIEMIVGWEENNIGENENYDYSSAFDDTAWTVSDLPTSNINPGNLGYLKQQGIIEQVMSSNSKNIDTLWALTDRDETKEALRINKAGEVVSVAEEELRKDQIPDDLFDPIVGHEDIKELFSASVESAEPVHILLVGPPACGKTVFLEEVSRLPNNEFMIGSSTTGPGFIDQLFEKKPSNILIDEFDKMGKEDYGNLLSLQEDGTVKEVKGNNKRREMQLENATIYATANRIEDIPSENLSRFMGDPVIELPEYTDEEFREVTNNVLTMREGTSEEMASIIADIIVDETDIRDFRECRRIARLASTEDDNKDVEDRVRKFTNMIEKYGSKSLI